MPRDLTDRTIVITGASSGIGAATALACARAGMHVTLAARRADKLMRVARQIADAGRKAMFFTCNVANAEDLEKLYEQHWLRFGRLDAVLANAGYGIVREAHATTPADVDALMRTNFMGTVYTLRGALKDIERTHDSLRHLLVTTSVLSELGPPCYGAYAASKAAQDVWAQAMRAELYDRGYDVTTVHPVGTRTEFFSTADRLSAKYNRGKRATNTPERFMQTPEHVAKRIVAALRRPRAEVWPSPLSRFGLAAATAFPGLTAYALRKLYRKQQRAASS